MVDLSTPPSTPLTTPLLAVLRAGTRDLHDRTEAAFALADPRLTRDGYRAVLAHLLPFYAGVEAALAPWVSALALLDLDLAARRKTPLLQRDLAALAATPSAAPGAAPGADQEVTDTEWSVVFPTLAHAIGGLYVLEGATLGGQLLRRQLGPALGLSPEHGLAFLTAYGAAVGPMWRAFGEAVSRFDTATPDLDRAFVREAATAGARTTFLQFEHAVVAPTALPPTASSPMASSPMASSPTAMPVDGTPHDPSGTPSRPRETVLR